jgi:alpha-D-ribose 1-methylphosphonate 5-triphosphate synthase subunit PhnI
VGYSGVKGGMDAILAAERLVRRKRAAAPWAAAAAIIESYRLAVDRVMGEAGLYDEAIAADAFRQAEGDLVEAAHLVRAYRSALPRLAVSTPTDPDEMTVLRRIVPASRTPDGPQLLGRTTDYTARVLERPRRPVPAPEEPAGEAQEHAPQASAERSGTGCADTERTDPRRPRRFYEQLLKADLAVDHGPVGHEAVDHEAVDHRAVQHSAVQHRAVQHGEPPGDPEPFDVSRGAARSPAPRSAVLASMARAETGALVALWYRSVRGPDGAFHEVTLGELRHGRLPVRVIHPLTGRPVEIGQVRATEAEAIEDLDGPAEDRTRLDVGYGLCFGHNERKAIAMASLDIAYRRAVQSGSGDELEQLLLLTTDGLDSGGFLDHLKLPHYVTFRSIVDRKLAARAALAAREGTASEPHASEQDASEQDAGEQASPSAAQPAAGDPGVRSATRTRSVEGV